LGLLAILLSGRSAHPALAVAAVLPLAHIGNAALSIPVQGILPRYMADSEWLLLILPALVAAWLVDRRARNPLDQSVDPFGATAV
jgi:hypothetical protein